ncbi:MAG: hypothetical protein Q7S40_21665 [Opitutaceae bacterium]|nr:hypothetical protein [Opitutaceae bacterium]
MKTSILWLLALFTASVASAALPIRVEFGGARSEHKWPLAELDPGLPADWTGYEFLVLEFRASSSQRFELTIDIATGRLSKRIGPFAGVWVRASIPLRFYRQPPGNAADLAATYNQPRSSYWINIGGNHGPTTSVRGLTVAMSQPVGRPTFELRSVALARTDPGDAVLDGKPLIDEFGQYRPLDWPGKVRTIGALKAAWAEEEGTLKATPASACPYGGFPDTKARPTGFFRVEQIDGRWWFVCPEGHLFFSSGMNGVGTASGTRVQGREDLFAALPPRDLAAVQPGGRSSLGGSSFYTWNLQRRFGGEARSHWADFTTQRLRAWGINTIHYWGPRSLEAATEPRVPYAQMLRGWAGAESLMGLPDVYAEDFPRRVDEVAAAQLGPRKDDRYLLGYFIGNEPSWPNRESQLVNLILAGRPGEMQRRLKEHLATGDTPERRKAFVLAAFERYLAVINAATRRHAPNHLNLGIRFGGSPLDDLLAITRGFDVFSVNIYRNAPTRAALERIHALVGRPLLIGEFHIGAPERGLAPGLVQAMNQEERGVAYRYYVEQAAAHPALIGAHWFQWLDQPATGRSDGENYAIGFIDVTDQPYRELVDAARLTHGRLLEVHGGKMPPFDRMPKASEAGTAGSKK